MAWFKKLFQSNAVDHIDSAFLGFTKMKARLEAGIEKAEVEHQDLENKMKKLYDEIHSHANKQILLAGAKKKANTVISNIEKLLSEAL